MSVKLQKGANTTLEHNGADDIIIGLGWQIKNNTFGLNCSAFMLNQIGKIRNDKDFIFCNQTEGPDACIILDDSPQLDSDSTHFHVNLSKIPLDVTKIIFTIAINEIENFECNFSMVEKAYIRIMQNTSSKQEFIRYDLENTNQEVTLIIGEIYRYKKNWKFRAVGQGYKENINAITSMFGIDINNYENKKVSEKKAQKATKVEKVRRSSKHIFSEKACVLRETLNNFLPQIEDAVDQKINESNTRMILDKIFMDVLGYKMEDIQAEQKIQGRKADYVLSFDGMDAIVVEAKKAGMALREKQIFQATSYGAYSGIKWALLTNLETWKLYHIATNDKVEADLVFSVNLLPNLNQNDSELLVLISRYGVERKSLLEKLWDEVKALSHENIISAILTEDVINKIRLIIKRDTRCVIDNEQIQSVVEEILQVN